MAPDVADMRLRCVKVVWHTEGARDMLPRLLGSCAGFQRSGYKKKYAVARFDSAEGASQCVSSGVFDGQPFDVEYLGEEITASPSDTTMFQLQTPAKVSPRNTAKELLSDKVEQHLSSHRALPTSPSRTDGLLPQPPSLSTKVGNKQLLAVEREKQEQKTEEEGKMGVGGILKVEDGGKYEPRGCVDGKEEDEDTQEEESIEEVSMSEEGEDEVDQGEEEDQDGSDISSKKSIHGAIDAVQQPPDAISVSEEFDGDEPSVSTHISAEQPRGLSRSMLDNDHFVHRDVTDDLQRKVVELELYINILEQQGGVREREREEYDYDVERQRIELEGNIVREREAFDIETRALQRQIQALSAKVRQVEDENKVLRREKEAKVWSDTKDLEDFRRKRLVNAYLGDNFGTALIVGQVYAGVSLPTEYGAGFPVRDQVRNLHGLGELTSHINQRLAKSKSEIGSFRKALSRQQNKQ
jgi:hypothetical protein